MAPSSRLAVGEAEGSEIKEMLSGIGRWDGGARWEDGVRCGALARENQSSAKRTHSLPRLELLNQPRVFTAAVPRRVAA